jgi:alkylation response protein AidB-like acyl-CoA dehydrogenase
MGTLGFERGTAFLATQLRFEHDVHQTVELAAKQGATSDPVVRQRLADAYIGLELLRFNRLRAFTAMAKAPDGQPGPEASINKLQWSNWHRRLGELQMDIMGPQSQIVGDGYHLDELQLTFLFSRSETIYAGSSEIQRNIIGERVLGLPREPSVA